MNLLKRKITKDQSRDTGMAMVLLFLLIFLGRKKEGWLFVAMALHVINMIVPNIYKPIAVLWLGLSDLLGAITSKILLGLLFFIVVTPIGIFRKLAGKDSLKLRAFKKSRESAMLTRNHMFSAKDIENPY